MQLLITIRCHKTKNKFTFIKRLRLPFSNLPYFTLKFQLNHLKLCSLKSLLK